MLERLVCVELWIEGSIDGYDKIEMEFPKNFVKLNVVWFLNYFLILMLFFLKDYCGFSNIGNPDNPSPSNHPHSFGDVRKTKIIYYFGNLFVH